MASEVVRRRHSVYKLKIDKPNSTRMNQWALWAVIRADSACAKKQATRHCGQFSALVGGAGFLTYLSNQSTIS